MLRRRAEQVETLRRVPLFSNLSQKNLIALARRLDRVNAVQGEVLAEEGRLGKEFFLIVEGSVAISHKGRTISTRSAGDFIGEMSLIDSQPRSATIIALEDCDLLVMHRRDFSEMVDSIPGFARKLLAGLAGRLREANSKLVD